MENCNYITLGIDCQPTFALKQLDLRKYALPFDWLTSNVNMIVECIKDDFKFFHQELRVDSNNILCDKYGFGFAHDYPFKKEGEHGPVDNWMDYNIEVVKKYERRIKRLNDILKSDTPIISIYKGPKEDIQYFKQIFKEKYNKTNIVYIIYGYTIVYNYTANKPTTENNNRHIEEIIIDNDIIICNPFDRFIDTFDKSIGITILSKAIEIGKKILQE